MPATVREHWVGTLPETDKNGRSRTRGEYFVHDAADSAAALVALEAATADAAGSLVKSEVNITGRLSETTFTGEVLWVSETLARNSSIHLAEQDGSYFSFETTGGTEHITHSLATVARYAPPGQTAPDFKQAINVTADGPQGLDITVPVYEFGRTLEFADAAVTTAYKQVLFALTGSTNDAAFEGFAAGEVLFRGVRGQKRNASKWDLDFRFSAPANATGLVIGTITGIAKKGWEYLWVDYEEVVDTTASPNRTVQRPASVHVERIYPEASFASLGI